MTSDPVLLDLAGADPDHYLVRPGESGRDAGWRRAADLARAQAWPEIARAYAADLGGASVVVGGSCALQGFAWRIASLTIGRWIACGEGISLATADVRVRLREGRTVGLALTGTVEGGPTTPETLASDLVGFLEPVVDASRTVSRLREKVAWGNVGSAAASVWRRAHDAAPAGREDAVLASARAFLAAPAWSWDEVPLTWQEPAPAAAGCSGRSLRYRRSTCCLIRLAPDHAACTACSDITPEEGQQRWAEAERTRACIPVMPVGPHVGV